MLTCLPYNLSRPSRRIVTGVALAAYLLAVVGFPLPMPASQDTSTPFPCQNHHCGCHSADQCWRSCCCFTAQERLAWAKKHGVVIPAEARAAMLCESHAHDDHHQSCCEHAEVEKTAGGHSCSQCREPGNRGKVGWVLGFQAQKCQGLSLLWVAAGVTLPLAVDTLWEFDWLQIGRAAAVVSELSSLAIRPDVPPPRA